jgi:PAS domain S-box-containing protein
VCGLDQKEGDRAISFCGHAMLAETVFIIPDTKKDVRFADNPMVIGKPFIRFYAGVPIFAADGNRIGTFCIKSLEPREMTAEEKETLKALASWAESEINLRNLSIAITTAKKSASEVETFFETSQDVMAIANTNGYFERLNHTLPKMLGLSEDELLKTPFISFVHPDDVTATNQEIAKLAQGAKTLNFTNRFVKKNGSSISLQWCATPIGTKLFAVARDITANIEKEMDLERLNKAMVDRELKMIELKEKIKSLEAQE